MNYTVNWNELCSNQVMTFSKDFDNIDDAEMLLEALEVKDLVLNYELVTNDNDAVFVSLDDIEPEYLAVYDEVTL